MAAAPADGEAAKRKVPQNFVGVVWDGPIRAAPEDLQAAQFPRMAAAGVESVRIAFHWSDAQPQENGPTDLPATDRLGGPAAARRMTRHAHLIPAAACA